MKVSRANIPSGSLIRKYLPVNYSDVYACSIPDTLEITPDDLMVAFWTKSPDWVENLFKIRNNMVRIFGLKGDRLDREILEKNLRSGTSYEFFSVLEKSDQETVLKLIDSHLDAIMSVYIEEDSERETKKVYLITLVKMHNLLGRVYFYTICPFHHMVVKSMLKHTLKTFYYQKDDVIK